MSDNTASRGIRRLIPVSKFNDYHPDPSPAAIRWMIYINKDGFEECVVRRGRRILIDEEAYFKWLDRQSSKSKLQLALPLNCTPWRRNGTNK